MKRNLTLIVHFIAVLLIVAGLGFLHRYSRNDTGITWMETEKFEDSVMFSELVGEDIASLKRLAVLKCAFEDDTDGSFDKERVVVTGKTNENGGISYTISDLLAAAAKYGYTMDETTHRIKVAEKPVSEVPYEVRVSYKYYDPFYFDNIEIGPSAGVTNIRELSVEALRALAEYYLLKSRFDTDKTNFYYKILVLAEGEEYEISNTSKSTDEIRALGRYMIVTDEMTIDSNITPQPDNVLSTKNSFEFLSEDRNGLEIGIDTMYIFNDRYKLAADGFEGTIRTARNWLIVITGSLLVMLITLILAVRGYSAEDRREITMDRIPLEALIFLCACASMIFYLFFKLTVNHAFEELLTYAEWEFWRDMGKGVIIWMFCVVILCSVYRRALNGGVFHYSLISGLFRALSSEQEGLAAWNALKGYIVFTGINIGACALIAWCYLNRFEDALFMIFAYLIAMVLAAFDIFMYVVRVRGFRQRDEIKTEIRMIADGNLEKKLEEARFTGDNLEIARNLNNISVGLETAIHEQVKADRLKADLITNVSHDIRTPLTSIINYVDLLKRENVQDPKLREYIEVLEKKSARLRNLTEDLLEASKASSGNIKLEMAKLDMTELAGQAGGEFDDKFAKRRLELDLHTPDHPVYVMADGRHLWRVFENLYNNAAKYALEGTRVYADVVEEDGKCRFTIKNVSQDKLNISPDELTERFVRGDVSRNTEGSGLGLSIAQSLTKLMGGELRIEIDGDLYKAHVVLDVYDPEAEERKQDVIL